MTVTVIQQDVLDFLRDIPDDSVDMAFADPPFNIKLNYADYSDDMDETEYYAWTQTWIKEMLRVLQPSGSIFIHNYPIHLIHTARMLMEAGGIYRNWIAWNAMGRPLGQSLQRAHYGILYFTKSVTAKRFDVRAPHARCRKCGEYRRVHRPELRHPDGSLLSDVWDDIARVRHLQLRNGGHPCQLPPALIERMLIMTTDPDDMVIDPFIGGGSTGMACAALRRQFRGADISAEYVAAANVAIANVTPAPDPNVSILRNTILTRRSVPLAEAKSRHA